MSTNYKLSTTNSRKPKPKVLVFSGYGLNCEDETAYAFERVGIEADIVHVNDLIEKPSLLKRYQIVAFPGGFSYGDDTGSGKAFGSRIRNHLRDELEVFLERDTLMIGMCNGFQIMTAAELVPGALLANAKARYHTRWVDLKVTGKSPWLEGIMTLSLPIAHGEGNFYTPPSLLKQMKKDDAVALTYVKGPLAKHFDLPANPNGSLENIAGVTSHGGRVFGLMPHPERAIRFTQLPHWTHLKEEYKRAGKKMPTEADGLQIFKNAARYFA